MLDLKQTDRMLRKLERFVDIIEPMIFEKVGEPGPRERVRNPRAFPLHPRGQPF